MSSLEKKQEEFNMSIELYHQSFFYRNFNKAISLIIFCLQFIAIITLFNMKLSFFWAIFSFPIAYLFTDFINGLVHMYMDNNDNYTSFFGPFIANFHLHHSHLRYKDKNIISIFYNESGSKYWLVIYYVIIIIFKELINPNLYLFFVFIALLSSVAEVSHFLCHNSTSKVVLFLQKIKILLPRKHHMLHHKKDNINYAFLNGVTDPLINFIAKKIYKGYKNNTDRHSALYIKKSTSIR